MPSLFAHLEADGNALRGHVFFHLADGELPEVKDRSGQHSICFTFDDSFSEMLELTYTA